MLSANRALKLPGVLVALGQCRVFVSTTDNHKHVLVKETFECRNSKTRKYHVGALHSHVRTPHARKRSYSLFSSRDTVFALSSGHGKCGRFVQSNSAVVRLLCTIHSSVRCLCRSRCDTGFWTPGQGC